MLADLGIGVKTPGGQGVDLEAGLGSAAVVDSRRWQGLVELGERALCIAFVEKVHRAIVAQSAGDERVGTELLGRACEQSVGFGKAAEV